MQVAIHLSAQHGQIHETKEFHNWHEPKGRGADALAGCLKTTMARRLQAASPVMPMRHRALGASEPLHDVRAFWAYGRDPLEPIKTR